MSIVHTVGYLIAPGCKCLKGSFDCLKPHYDYVKKVDKNLKQLKLEFDDLDLLRSDIKDSVQQNQDLEMTSQCRNCFIRVEQIEESIRKLEEEYQRTRKYLFGMWPFLKLRKLGKHIVKTTKEVVEINDVMIKLKQGRNTTTARRPKPLEPRHATDNIVELHSVSQKLQQLLKHLRDETVNRIGISGMEGIGKTTLLEKLNIEADKEGRFSPVIFISVQGVDSVTKIQEDILKQLKLQVNDTISSNEEVAALISQELEKMKYLVLLDQVSSEINLDHVGIRSSHKYGKVVVASISRCKFKKMNVQARIELEGLPLDDARHLFQTIVGDVIENRPRIKEISELIVRELGGLPLLIKAVARTLRDEDSESFWNNTLKALKAPIESQQQYLQDVFNGLKHVFDRLLTDRQKCLLYVSLFPDNRQIYEDYLVECWRIERFIRDDPPVIGMFNVKPFREVRDEGDAILSNLIDKSLLERCRRVKYIRMPKLVRKLALETLYSREKDCKPIVEAGQNKEECPPEKDWRHTKRISLMCNKLHSLPDNPKWSNLSTLFLQKNAPLQSIPKFFVSQMCNLQLLDLYKTGIESLPSSLFSLIKLRGLYLNHCLRLAALPAKISKLKNLEVLDICDTGIRSLPSQIGKLGNLKCFRVSFLRTASDSSNTRKNNIPFFWKHEKPRAIIPPDVIKKLYQLEELTIIVDPKEQSWNEVVDMIAEEVASLKMLSTLCFYFPCVDSLNNFVKKSISWNNKETSWGGNSFSSYKMQVGYHEANHSYELHSSVNSDKRFLRFSAGEGTPPEIGEVLKHASAFELIGHSNVKSLSEFDMANLKSLEVCVIQECKMMESIVDANSSDGDSVFPVLEKLHLINLELLNCIWRGPVMQGSLAKLRTLTLNDCPLLTKLLSRGITQQLRQLQCLRVENCSQITEIIEAEHHSQVTEIVKGENVSRVTEIVEVENYSPLPESSIEAYNFSRALPKLETLELVNLPCLESICRSDELGWPFLERIKINGCPVLRDLSLSTTNAGHLSSIFCNKDWWVSLQFQLQDDLRQHLEQRVHFIDDEEPDSPSVYGTPTAASPEHGVIHNQQLVNHIVENQMTGHASSSMAAATRQHNDPSSLTCNNQGLS